MNIASMYDGGSRINVQQSIVPAAVAASTVNGTGIDRAGVTADQEYFSGVLEVSLGATTGAPTTISVAVSLQDSSDNSTFAAVGSSFGGPIAITTATAASQVVTANFNGLGLRRYVRAVAVVSFTGGTSPTIVVGANIVLCGAAKAPTP